MQQFDAADVLEKCEELDSCNGWDAILPLLASPKILYPAKIVKLVQQLTTVQFLHVRGYNTLVMNWRRRNSA
jgi:hypothetical protein